MGATNESGSLGHKVRILKEGWSTHLDPSKQWAFSWFAVEANEYWHRMMGECQAVVAETVAAFGRVDILLCCTSQGR